MSAFDPELLVANGCFQDDSSDKVPSRQAPNRERTDQRQIDAYSQHDIGDISAACKDEALALEIAENICMDFRRRCSKPTRPLA